MIHNRKVAALVPIKDHSERVKGKTSGISAEDPYFIILFTHWIGFTLLMQLS